MKKATNLLAGFLCLAGLLFAATSCGDRASPPSIEYTAVPVSTKLEVPGGEICGSAPTVGLPPTPPTPDEVPNLPVGLRPGEGKWQEGYDLFLQMASSSGKSPYGLIFLHGGSEVVPNEPGEPPARGFACGGDSLIATEIGFVQQLLQDLGGGIAAFPQALPKFDYTLYLNPEAKNCPNEKICLDPQNPETYKNSTAECVAVSPKWLPPVPSEDYVDEWCHIASGSNALATWKPFFEEYGERIKTIVLDFHRGRGIPLEKIYLLGFSEGAVMAQRALLSLANEGIRIGGGIGFDGNDVQMIASKETFENLRPPHPEILYFLYSPCAAARKATARCFENYPGLNLQFYEPPGDKHGTHSTYMALVEPTQLWIQARNKRTARAAVQQAWDNAVGEIHPCEASPDPCATPPPAPH